jgi:hypothetical protein
VKGVLLYLTVILDGLKSNQLLETRLMNKTSTLSAKVVGLLALVAFAGCGQSGPRTYPVTGTVMYQGSPVEGAMVSFSPVDPEGHAAFGTTDAQGRYALTSFQQNDGAVVGEYKVRVTKYGGTQAPVQLADRTQDTGGEMPADYRPEAATEAPPARSVLPDKYAHAHSSPLTYTVQAGENEYNITLE